MRTWARPASWPSLTSKKMKTILVRGRMSHTCLQLLGNTWSRLHGLLWYQQEWFSRSRKCFWQPHSKSPLRAKCKQMTLHKDGPRGRRFWSVMTMSAARPSSLASFLPKLPGSWGNCAASLKPLRAASRKSDERVHSGNPGSRTSTSCPGWSQSLLSRNSCGLTDHQGVDEPAGVALQGKSFHHLGGPGEARGGGRAPAYHPQEGGLLPVPEHIWPSGQAGDQLL